MWSLMALGLDIYRYQTVTNWGAVKNHGVQYIWVKLTDGGGPAIVKGDAQVNGAKSIGIPVGGYHYAQFSPSPEAQADILLREVDRLGAHGLVPMLDIEAPFSANQQAKDFAVRFCDKVAARGHRPGVYMSDSFARVLRPDTWPVNPVIWIARYGARPAYPGRYDVHQYSSSGTVPGIIGSVDMNESYTNAHFAQQQEAPDMLADERQALLDIRHQLTGSPTPGQYPGWESFVDPAANLTPVDFIRYIDQATNETRQLVGAQAAELVEMKARVAGVQVTTDMTNQTVQQLAVGGVDTAALAAAVAASVREELAPLFDLAERLKS